MAANGCRLGIDFGTSTTVAMLAGPGERVRPLLFDSSPLLPSAVFAGPGDDVLVGLDAERAGIAEPAALEPNPKRRVDDGTVLLASREIPVVSLVAAVLRRVGAEARRVAGAPPDEVVLTHPATWAAPRLAVLRAAAEAAALRPVRFVPEPVAAAVHFTNALGHRVPEGGGLVAYDLGGGTADVTVLRAVDGRFEVVATGGVDDVGGLDLDATVVAHARELTCAAADEWRRLDNPSSEADRRARHTLWREARAAKEYLSRHPTAELTVPLVDVRVHLTREEFEAAARPYLDRTVAVTGDVLRQAAFGPRELTGVYLVGGSSRIPLVATLLHRTLGVTPVVIDHPELVVAEGSLRPAVGAAQPITLRVPDDPTRSWPSSVPLLPPPSRPALPPRPPGRLVRLARSRSTRITAAVLAMAAALVVTVETLTSNTPPPTHPEVTTSQTARVEGARALGAPIQGHTDAIQAVVFSPDGKTMATAGWDRSVIFWDVLLRRQLDGPHLGPRDHIADIAYSPDGRMLAVVGGDQLVWLFDALRHQPTGEPIAGHTNLINKVSFSPDSKTLATAADDDTVRLWDVATRTQIGEPLRHNGWVRGLAFSPDGSALATASYDRLVRIWDVATHQLRHEPMAGHTDAIGDLAWSPNGSTLATVSGDGTLRFWDVAAGRQSRDPLDLGAKWSSAVAFSPDGGTVATGSDDNAVRLWSVERRTRIGEPLQGHTDAIADLAFNHAGTTLTTVSNDRTIRVWEILT